MGDHRHLGKPFQYVTSHPRQLSLAIPPRVGAISTSGQQELGRKQAQRLIH